MGIPVHLDRLIDPKAARKLASVGLDKVAAALLKTEGIDVGEVLTMKTAVQVLGAKLRQKNAEYARIRAGFDSLKQLSKSE